MLEPRRMKVYTLSFSIIKLKIIGITVSQWPI